MRPTSTLRQHSSTHLLYISAPHCVIPALCHHSDVPAQRSHPRRRATRPPPPLGLSPPTTQRQCLCSLTPACFSAPSPNSKTDSHVGSYSNGCGTERIRRGWLRQERGPLLGFRESRGWQCWSGRVGTGRCKGGDLKNQTQEERVVLKGDTSGWMDKHRSNHQGSQPPSSSSRHASSTASGAAAPPGRLPTPPASGAASGSSSSSERGMPSD